MSGSWEIGEVVALLANPFYAINIHPSFARVHERTLTESQWVRTNIAAVRDLGSSRWLREHLASLQEPHLPAQPGPRMRVADPYEAVTVHRTLCERHEPLVNEAEWVGANERGLADHGEDWLHSLLAVLKGGFVRG
jgi:hypothetical protein